MYGPDRNRNRLRFPKRLVGVRPQAKTFMHIITSISHSSSVTSIISPILQMRTLSFKELPYLPEVTSLVSGRDRIETQETAEQGICIT